MATTLIPRPLNIFILAGQSNSIGFANLQHLQELATSSDPIVRNEYAFLRNDDNTNWKVRDDVFVAFERELGDVFPEYLQGPLVANGFGGSSEMFGPEVGFGFAMGDYYSDESDTLIIKAGGIGPLATEWRPPSSGDNDDNEKGYFYREMIRYVQSVMENIHEIIPGSSIAAATTTTTTTTTTSSLSPPPQSPPVVTLAGFIWHQGYGDVFERDYLVQYGPNLINLINDVRMDLNTPQLPFVIVETGGEGTKDVSKNEIQIRAIQKAVANHFGGTVRVAQTAKFVTGFDETDPSMIYDTYYHYYGRADIIIKVGQEIAQEMITLLNPVPSQVPSAAPSNAPTMMPTTTTTTTTTQQNNNSNYDSLDVPSIGGDDAKDDFESSATIFYITSNTLMTTITTTIFIVVVPFFC